ncbi:thymidine phosphorylase [Iamia sp.]|uniref:thymidine phosphorylase n=1 Tax=Iamia sp. TaxID=2722710 RepID=UPI002D06DEB2|nr:thymidine phosphorylase [Iamia sp.]HXH58691.1 thymidine phosphorylase [Iamia sp.]
MATDILDVLRTKRDGGTLTDEQIHFALSGFTAGTVADEQMAALCMAILFRGLSPTELSTWTQVMLDSGSTLDLAAVGRPTVDKHSTGGVGDKVSMILVPLVAACGAAVPQLAGRGLGHTGGTLDKLGAIAGWSPQLSPADMVSALRDVGGVICGAGDDLAPADRRLYALRDVTATVEAIPLIASSIMSKKIASGTRALVLDVKVGSGAFLPEVDRARALAATMVGLGRDHGVDTVALLTDMETPLGRACGNALEVTESIEVLQGGGPADVREVTLALAREMVALAGLDADPAEVLDSGRAMDVFDAMVRVQGGDPEAPLPAASDVVELAATATGHLRRLDARAVGIAAWRLGAGRARKEDPVSASAGIVCRAKPGDRVIAGQVVLELHVDDPDRVEGAIAALEGAIEVGDTPAEPRPLVLDRIT